MLLDDLTFSTGGGGYAGTTFPPAPVKSQLFYITAPASEEGLYYSDGTTWIKFLDEGDDLDEYLNDVGVPGLYYSVATDSKGRVVGGSSVLLPAQSLATPRTISISGGAVGSTVFDGSADANIALTIQALDFSAITTGKPTTLAGYGITNAVAQTSLGALNGVATLDGTGKVTASQLPAITITDTFVVASQAAMLALTAQTGDVAIRTDLSKTFILKGTSSSTLADWQELATPVDSVTSVNGLTGTVVLSTVPNVSGIVAIANGGTGATTASTARASLNAAAAGVNTDITSLNAPALGAATATTPSLGDNSTRVATTAFVTNSGGVPAGSVIYVLMPTPPTGYLKANGAQVSRTTYATLFAAIGTTFGAGNGSTTFHLPDLRGEFVRGWDDGRGADPGRGFGYNQADDFRSHSHNLPGTILTYGAPGGGSGVLVQISSMPTSATGGTETRPRNVALLACVKT